MLSLAAISLPFSMPALDRREPLDWGAILEADENFSIIADGFSVSSTIPLISHINTVSIVQTTNPYFQIHNHYDVYTTVGFHNILTTISLSRPLNYVLFVISPTGQNENHKLLAKISVLVHSHQREKSLERSVNYLFMRS